jgi:transcriptional regulator with XRE-family HTH domain
MSLGSDDRTNEPFGHAVRALLKAEGRSQNMLSKELGIDKGQLSRALNTGRGRSLKLIDQIASAVEKPASYFVEVRLARINDYLRENEEPRERLWEELAHKATPE